jgi:hypothetical protein
MTSYYRTLALFLLPALLTCQIGGRTAEAADLVDQQQTDASFSFPTDYWVQTFTPTQNNISGFDIYVVSSDAYSFLIRIFATGELIAAVGAVPLGPGVQHIDVEPPAPLTPGTKYVISIHDSTASAIGDTYVAGGAGNLYAGGAAGVTCSPYTFDFCGTAPYTTENSSYDLFFRTYYRGTADGTAPHTTILSGPMSPTNSTSATFTFSGSDDVTPPESLAFECSLDGASFAGCDSGATYPSLGQGAHTFQVRSIDAAGNIDSTPPSWSWTVDVTPTTAVIDSHPSALTNSTTANFSFHAVDANSTLACQLDSEPVADCTVGSVGYTVGEGPHTFTVMATDQAGNVDTTPPSFGWTVDLTAPDTTIDSHPPALTNSNSPSFTFHASEVGTLVCQLDNGIPANCNTGMASYGGVGEGVHTFSVTAMDLAGNVDASAATFTWTVDLTPPPDPAISAGPANPTNQSGAAFNFSDSETGLTFLCQLDGGGFSACVSPASYTGLTGGGHTFGVKAQDAARNPSNTVSYSWTVDLTPPPIPAITSSPANPTNQTSASFGFSDAEAGVSFLCRLDASGFSACSSPKSYSGLAPGSHTFAVQAQDAVGNKSSSANFTWTIDTTAPPKPTITSGPSSPTSMTSATFSFGDAEASANFLCQLDGGGFSACVSPKVYSGLTLGGHSFTVRALDAAGNQSGPTTFSWTIVAAPPTPTITSGPASATKQTSATFAFTDSQAGVSFLCQLDAGAQVGCSSPQLYAGLTSGSHTFLVKAQDGAGHQSAPASFTWTIDLTPPPPPTISSGPASTTKQTKATFKFTDTEAGVSFTCQLDGGPSSACSSPQNYSGVSLGSHTFAVKAQDAAGNQSAAASFTWTITP